jgi:hypothetical protein
MPMVGRSVRIVLSLFALCAVVVGCARNASLYPANDEATASGVLSARFNAYGTGHGEIQIPMPDGEVLKGEYSIVRGGAVGFGTIYGSVYGNGGTASYHGQSTTYVMPGRSPEWPRCLVTGNLDAVRVLQRQRERSR